MTSSDYKIIRSAEECKCSACGKRTVVGCTTVWKNARVCDACDAFMLDKWADQHLQEMEEAGLL